MSKLLHYSWSLRLAGSSRSVGLAADPVAAHIPNQPLHPHDSIIIVVVNIVLVKTVREGIKKNRFFFRKKSLTMGGWGSRVLNFLVKIHIQLFVLQTSSNVLKHISHKVRRSYLAISGCFDAPKIFYC